MDGPSLGTTFATILTSLATGLPLRHTMSLTGEITLEGRVKSVGSLAQKVEAAKRFGIKELIIPVGNRPQWEAMKKEHKSGIIVHFVVDFAEIYNLLFG